jgi:hypothetical protein
MTTDFDLAAYMETVPTEDLKRTRDYLAGLPAGAAAASLAEHQPRMSYAELAAEVTPETADLIKRLIRALKAGTITGPDITAAIDSGVITGCAGLLDEASE